MSNFDGDTVVGSKTGLMKIPQMHLDGAEGDVNRTGMFKRKEKPFDKGEGEERKEPPAPPTLPEINQDDGGTTGVVTLDTEGNNSAKREDHPRR